MHVIQFKTHTLSCLFLSSGRVCKQDNVYISKNSHANLYMGSCNKGVSTYRCTPSGWLVKLHPCINTNSLLPAAACVAFDSHASRACRAVASYFKVVWPKSTYRKLWLTGGLHIEDMPTQFHCQQTEVFVSDMHEMFVHWGVQLFVNTACHRYLALYCVINRLHHPTCYITRSCNYTY